MQLKELGIPGVWEITPRQLDDERGIFLEAFADPAFRRISGHRFDLAQMNMSISGEGVLRGLHFAEVPPGQAKYVLCPKGTVFDVVVDVRVGSPTFGEWCGLILDDVDRRAVYIPEGMAHGFLALEPQSTVQYLCSQGWRPGAEHVIDAFDPHLGIQWPVSALDGTVITHVMSDKDRTAPSLLDVAAAGLLPRYDECLAYVQSLRALLAEGDEIDPPSAEHSDSHSGLRKVARP